MPLKMLSNAPAVDREVRRARCRPAIQALPAGVERRVRSSRCPCPPSSGRVDQRRARPEFSFVTNASLPSGERVEARPAWSESRRAGPARHVRVAGRVERQAAAGVEARRRPDTWSRPAPNRRRSAWSRTRRRRRSRVVSNAPAWSGNRPSWSNPMTKALPAGVDRDALAVVHLRAAEERRVDERRAGGVQLGDEGVVRAAADARRTRPAVVGKSRDSVSPVDVRVAAAVDRDAARRRRCRTAEERRVDQRRARRRSA